MQRENALRRRLHSLDTLSETISAMKSLAAHHFREARSALPAAREYRTQIDRALASGGLHRWVRPGNAKAILLIAADVGLCDGYNSRLSSAAIQHHQQVTAACVYCVGRRPLPAFKRAGISIDRNYRSPTSVAGLTGTLLQLSEDIIDDYLNNRFNTLTVVSARFDGVGDFTPVSTQLLPVDLPKPDSSIPPSSYVSIDHLAAVAVREYLYIRLFQTALDSLASEHSARLVATESAGSWLAEKTSAARRQLSSIRREAATQEVLDIAATAKRRNKRLG